MKVSLQWLRAFVPISLAPEELAARLTLTGTKVDLVDRVGAAWQDILVARIVRLEPHPDPEVRLQLVTLDLGDRGEMLVVTGAFNIHVEDKVPYAGVGVTLPTGLTLKPRQLRGVVSHGMILANDELGLGEDHAGIRILDRSAPQGAPLADVLGDAIFTLEITSNRPDCLSVIGVAREVAAATGASMRVPDVQIPTPLPSLAAHLTVRLEAADACPRFSARVIDSVKIGPSPDWLAARLNSAGVRSINNVVDITNYVMLEYGQPMHAYDLSALSGGLGIRRARAGEVLETLDGQERRLSDEMVVIETGDRAIGLAGIMGGASTEIRRETTSIALEVATWDASTIRRTSARLGLRTEASTRFEKGLPPYLTLQALDRATALLVDLAGGTPGPLIDVGEAAATEPRARRTILLPAGEPERLLGMPLRDQQVRESLTAVGFEVTGPDETAHYAIQVPPWRADVEEVADIIEEIARIVGYDQVPESRLRGMPPIEELEAGFLLAQRLRPFLLACGLSEASNHVLTGAEALARLRSPEAVGVEPLSPEEVAAIVPNSAAVAAAGATFGPIIVQNPLSPERSRLRHVLAAALVENCAMNLRLGRQSIGLFEIGRTYFPRPFHGPDPDILPALERRTLGIAMAGSRSDRSWAVEDRHIDFYDLRGIVERLMEMCGIDAYIIEAAAHPILHPGRGARLWLADRRGRRREELAFFGELHPLVAERFGLPGRGVVLELDIDQLAAGMTDQRRFTPLSRYPAVHRDLAVLVGRDVAAREVIRAIRQGGGKLLQDVSVFDVYTGEQIAENEKSLAVSLLFQSDDRTLAEQEIDGLIGHIQRRLRDVVGGRLRL